ncbi:KAP family P-loop NTPase fold protein [Luteococcus japonicus]|uniref:Phage T7 exclusion protein n=1 Tax=Luteococcus japonicus LSP_Lj1 TaxID=1255658 RepID=A0A1R4JZE7_9ACTN|nr:KAP family NTPase [Luteococcus japonicus]SJN37437.1 Phage T7 exclusion protein [Luteococcus japonicus LSP_Lj1]
MTQQSSPTKAAHGGWHDDPITSPEQDALGRTGLASRLARLINETHTRDSSVVYGLQGPWGCGKSSVIALIEHCLGEQDGRWQVVRFTPWATTGTDGLLREFFAALVTVAPDSKKREGLRTKISDYAAVARPFVALVPTVGQPLAEASKAFSERSVKPWTTLFNELAAEIRALGVPVLVVVDDIDRLQNAELLDLLKVVRLLGRFPGVDFLLAYDEATLVETLRSGGTGLASRERARTFMEKIVQYPIDVPPMLKSQVLRRLSDRLEAILAEECPGAEFDRHRFSDVLTVAMTSQLTTPRAIERFLAQVREQLRAHQPDEINQADLVMAVFLQVQFPGVFDRLQDWKGELTRRVSPTMWIGSSSREPEKPDWTKLVDGLTEADQRNALVTLKAIFPSVSGPNAVKAGSLRFAHPDYFGRYLAQTVPEGDVPDNQVMKALSQAAEGDPTSLRALLSDGAPFDIALVLGKITDRYPDPTDQDYWDGPVGPATRSLLGTVMEILGDHEEPPGALWSPYSTLRRWAAILFRKLAVADPVDTVDAELARCADTLSRVHVLTLATTKTESFTASVAGALNATLEREVERLIPELLEDLSRGDASTMRGQGFLFDVAATSKLDELKQLIATGVDANDFTLEDLAARLVSTSYLVGGDGRIHRFRFEPELFTRLTGIPAKGRESKTDDGEPDGSWAARRAFVATLIGTFDEPTET